MAKGCAIFNAADAVAYLNTSLPPGETMTLGAWFYINTRAAGTNQTFFYINSATDIGVRLNTSNEEVLSGPGALLTGVPSASAWFYLAIVTQAAVGTRIYRYNASLTQDANDFNAGWSNGGTIAEVMFGNNLTSGGSQGWATNGLRVSQARMWSAALSQAEIEAELASSTPVITGTLLESFENDPATDGWTTSGVIASTAYWPPNYTGDEPVAAAPRRVTLQMGPA